MLWINNFRLRLLFITFVFIQSAIKKNCLKKIIGFSVHMSLDPLGMSSEHCHVTRNELIFSKFAIVFAATAAIDAVVVGW